MSEIYGTIFFLDGSKIALRWPQQELDPTTLASIVRKALESDRLMAEIDGELFVIPVKNVKYFQVSPAPDRLPENVLRSAKVADLR